MSLHTTALGGLVAFIGVGGLSCTAYSATSVHCGNFAVQVLYTNVEYLDSGAPGVGVGDQRFGHQQLSDANNEHIGDQYFHTIVVPGGSDEFHQAIVSGHTVFANGTIDWAGTGPIADPQAEANPGLPDEVRRSVVGGTGDFAGARGTVVTFYDDERRGTREFDIICLE